MVLKYLIIIFNLEKGLFPVANVMDSVSKFLEVMLKFGSILRDVIIITFRIVFLKMQ